jgi:hypothetical protein
VRVRPGPSAGLRVELSARTSGSHVRFVSTGTHSWSRTNRTDKFFPIGCPLVRKRRFSWRSGSPRPLLTPLSTSGCRASARHAAPSFAPGSADSTSRPAGLRKAGRSCAEPGAQRARHRKTSALPRVAAGARFEPERTGLEPSGVRSPEGDCPFGATFVVEGRAAA